MNKEKMLTDIKLKYYKLPEKNDTTLPFFKCSWCLKKNNKSGGGFVDKKGEFKQICESCAILRYKEDYNLKTLDIARAKRRRIFDVGYLFNESVLDIYMIEKKIKRFEECDNTDDFFIKATELYNTLLSKEDKIKLEEIELQKDIESEINKVLLMVNFDKFFLGL